MDIYKKIMDYCRIKNPARCWFDYPPTYLLSYKINFNDIKEFVHKLIYSNWRWGLYINIPFCENKCLYCMYYSEVVRKSDIDKISIVYCNAIEAEIRSFQADFKKRKITNLYIGGGTPLLLSVKQLKRLFQIIYGNFVFSSNSQIIIEGRPKDFTEEKLKILVENKINRVTIGVQSFNENTLKKMGRYYTVKDVYDAFARVRRAGIKIINLDIIVGLFGEGKKEYKKTLDHLLRLSPDCISCTRMLYGERVKIPVEDQVSDRVLDRDYFFFDETFRQNGYFPIENKEGVYMKGGLLETNNKLLFDNLSGSAYILGLGARAISYLPDIRYAANKVDDYIKTLKSNKKANYYGMFMDQDDRMREYVILQLYLFHKINLTDFFNKFGVSLIEVFKDEISGLLKSGVIKKVKQNGDLLVLAEEKLSLKDFFYNMLKFVYKKKYINDINDKMKSG